MIKYIVDEKRLRELLAAENLLDYHAYMDGKLEHSPVLPAIIDKLKTFEIYIDPEIKVEVKS